MEGFSHANRSVYDLRRYLISKGITVGTFKKASLVKLAEAASTLDLQDNVDFHDDVLDLSERLRINGVQVPDPFSIPENELSYKLNDVPPFGIEDIFNFLVFKSSEYDRQKIASYKAFEEYALFEDGYVQDLKVKELNGHFIFVGKVKPTMITETSTGKFYDLWFIVDGTRLTDKQDGNKLKSHYTDFKWAPTAGSVFSAYCMCPGGQDGACKHIAAAMYSLHDCMYPEDKAPTEELCYWKKRETKTTCPMPVKDVKVAKASTLMKKHNFRGREKRKEDKKDQSNRKQGTRGPFKDKIDFDPRTKEDRVGFSPEKLRDIKIKLNEFNSVAGLFLDSDDDTDIPSSDKSIPCDQSNDSYDNDNDTLMPIIYHKVKNFLDSETEEKGHEEFLDEFELSAVERKKIENCTRGQGEMWKVQRKGFVTSTKLKEVYTRQKSIEKDETQSGIALSKRCLEPDSLGKYPKVPPQIEYGRQHEEVARSHYKKLMLQTHENFELIDMGLQISERDNFIAASPDNLKACKCCGEATVEYKCPYANRHLHPREAFLDRSIGGKQNSDGTYYLDPNHRYYFQIQGAMAMLEYNFCDFVIYTENSINNCDGSIFVLQVPFSREFWEDVRQTVRQFYLTWMLPIIFQEVIDETDVESKDIADNKSTPMIVDDETTEQESNLDLKDKEPMIVDDDLPTSSQCSLGDIKGVPLFQDDIDSLSEGSWLTDNIVVLFCRLLREKCESNILFSHLIILDSIFYLSLSSTLEKHSIEKAFSNASTHFQKMDPNSVVVVPICSHNHWYCIVFTQYCILVMDSLSHQCKNVLTRNHQINIIGKFIFWKFNIRTAQLKRFILKFPQQDNSFDCGVYLLLNLQAFLKPDNFSCFIKDPDNFCRKVHTDWFNAETARRERVRMKEYIISNL